MPTKITSHLVSPKPKPKDFYLCSMEDKDYMQLAINLAKKGGRNAAPNPMVGSVIVYEDKIIGQGYHQKCGEAHAEVNAVNSVEDKSLLPHATIYVSLEPCAHYGKTPPCADLIVKSKFKRCVIACTDPFSEVSGKGIQRIKDAGIETTVGVLENEALELNKRFFTYHQKQRPYVILKWAQSKDGFMDIDRSENQKGVYWITQPETKKVVHQWRAEEQAILVGWKTIANDNASLTVREVQGENPVRFIIDPQLSIPKTAQIFLDGVPTIIYTQKENTNLPSHIALKQLDNISVEAILKDLYERKMLSVFIEGGAYTLQAFIASRLWDEARILTGDTSLIKGQPAPRIKGKTVSKTHLGKDEIHILYKEENR